MNARLHRLMTAKTTNLNHIDVDRREEALADRIAARIDEMTADPSYLGYAWDMPAVLRMRLDHMVMHMIDGDDQLRMGFRAALASRAEREVVQEIENEIDEAEAEAAAEAYLN